MYVGKPEAKFKVGDSVEVLHCGRQGLQTTIARIDNDPTFPYIITEGARYRPSELRLLPPKPATVTRKPLFIEVPPFIGGPLDGQQLGYGDTCVETLNISAEGKPLSVTDKGHTYRLGTVNGEQMMIYERHK